MKYLKEIEPYYVNNMITEYLVLPVVWTPRNSVDCGSPGMVRKDWY